MPNITKKEVEEYLQEKGCPVAFSDIKSDFRCYDERNKVHRLQQILDKLVDTKRIYSAIGPSTISLVFGETLSRLAGNPSEQWYLHHTIAPATEETLLIRTREAIMKKE